MVQTKRKPALFVIGKVGSYRPTKASVGEMELEKIINHHNELIRQGKADKNSLITKALQLSQIRDSGTVSEKLKIMEIDLEDILSLIGSKGLNVSVNESRAVKITEPVPVISSSEKSQTNNSVDVELSKDKPTSGVEVFRSMKKKSF